MSVNNKISIVIPFYNESENIEMLVSSLNEYAINNRNKFELEFIFVDDKSSDNSFEILSHQVFSASTKIIRLSKNSGSHIAFRAGLMHSTHSLVTQTSADLQHPLSIVGESFELFNEGDIDLVVAMRVDTAKISLFEKYFSKVYTSLIQKYAVSNYPEGGFDIFMINQKIKDLMNANIEDNSSILLQILSFQLPLKKIYYNKLERNKGKSKWTLKKKIKLLIDSFVAFSYMPIRFVSFVGILFFILGVLWTIYVISRKLLYDDLTSGWPALTSILLLGFGITNISLGIIAEYLWRTLDSSRRRPVYVIDKIVELNSNTNNH